MVQGRGPNSEDAEERAACRRLVESGSGLVLDAGADRPGRAAHDLPGDEWARRLLVYGRLADLGLPLFGGRLDDEALQPTPEEVARLRAEFAQGRGKAQPSKPRRVA